MKYKKIAFIGMMGCGKSTISKLLSKKNGFDFVDLDEFFEQENNIKIKDYFKSFGEESFRRKETEILEKFSKKENIIISTGGGVVLAKENQDILFSKNIFTIYLKTSVDSIFDRIKDDKTRPLLLVKNPKSEIEKILNSRKSLYEKANLTVTTDNKTKEEITEEIWKKLI